MASIVPDKNLFIVTSALEPRVGVITKEDRFKQTIATLQNLKQKVPEALILFTDGSPVPCDPEYVKEISKLVHIEVYWHEDAQIKDFGMFGKKSEAEILLLLKTLTLLKQNPNLQKVMSSVKRIFKYSARSLLQDEFSIGIYDNSNLYGKYVFKERIPTWIDDKSITTHLLITRLFSLCPSLLDDYMQTLIKILNSCMSYGIDTENAHFREIDKKYLVELRRLYCEGIMAGTGKKEVY